MADYRTETPSAAAESCVPDVREIYELVGLLDVRSTKAINYILKEYKSNLKQILASLVFKKPFDKIHFYYRELDQTSDRLNNAFKKVIELKIKDLEVVNSKLMGLSPWAVLGRGYSIVMKDNKIIKDVFDVDVGNDVEIILNKGSLNAEIRKIIKNQEIR